jgi:Arc/MetJ family transcription regulator
MATNLMLDDDLIVQAMEMGKHRTKRETVNEALRAYVAGLQQERILDLFGHVDFDPDYDYKAARRRTCE